MTTSQLAGILPAIVFPTATAVQLYRILRSRSVAGVSASSWFLFGCANVGLYFYAGRYSEWQLIVGTLLTAALDFVIAGLAVFGFRIRQG
ncbi:MAG TPA: hypothetical protein VHE61_17125 [Opitutaceae bacterium]|nr:hypothetical protein [Opitutaceae bacterium]